MIKNVTITVTEEEYRALIDTLTLVSELGEALQNHMALNNSRTQVNIEAAQMAAGSIAEENLESLKRILMRENIRQKFGLLDLTAQYTPKPEENDSKE